MANNTYALVVGINDYSPTSHVPSLRGCNNDAQAISAYLKGRVANPEENLHIRLLLNEQATRQALIDSFRNHLCQAGPDDVAFFFYAGHGAQENAPEEFWHIEPDRLDETLVCYDSRTEGSWDLADKELAKLIAEVAEKNPHIVVIMDCCHSGSGTRGDLESTVAVRRAPVDHRQRPLSSFIVSPEQLPTEPATRSLNTPTSGWQMPQGRHVLLAACRDIEEAKEYAIDGKHHGTFSYFLLETLQKANGALTYRELFKRVSALVQSRVTAQSPQLEANSADDINQPFLGGLVKPRLPHFQVAFDRTYGWTMDGGAIHGIAQPVAGETTVLSLFPFNAADDVIRQGLSPIGTASVTAVKPSLSQVQVTGIPELQQDMTFKAVIKALPLPPLGIHLTGEEAGVALLQEAIAKAGDGVQQPSLYIRTVEDPAMAVFQILVQDSQYRIKRPADDRILVAPIVDYTHASAAQIVQRLEHLARWTNTLELQSSPTSRIAANAVQMEILQPGQTTEGTDLRLTYTPDGQPPAIQIRLKNTSHEPLYCAVVNLTERFGIQVPFFEAGGVWLEPDQEGFAKYFDKRSGTTKTLIPISIPKDVLAQGITEYKDVLKLLVSNNEFDAQLLTQDNLDVPRTRSLSRAVSRGMLNRLMNKVQTRDIGDDDDDMTDDWVISQITITTVRPNESADLAATSETRLMAGITIQNAADFQAKVR